MCGAETWTLLQLDKKHLEYSVMFCWGMIDKIILTDQLRSEANNEGQEYPTNNKQQEV